MKAMIIAVAIFVFALGVSSVGVAGITLISASPTVVVKITPEAGESGVKNLYVGAVYNGILYLRGSTATRDWYMNTGGPFQIAGKINTDGGPSVVTITDFDISSLVGLELYVAYGVSESDALHTPGHLARIYTVPSAVSANSGFTHYGFYSYSAGESDLADLATYTHTTFARSVEQVQLAKSYGFRDIIYEFRFEGILMELLASEGIVVIENPLAYDFRRIAGYATKALELYRRRLISLKSGLVAAGVLDDVGMFVLSDEPALHRNYVPDQAFLDGIENTFKSVFPDKKSTMAFAEDRLSTDPFRGTHLLPPPTLDVITVDPYFWDNTSTGCDEIGRSLYATNQNSTISWALQFGKPIIVAGDAMLRSGVDPLTCYVSGTYNILKNDPRIIGLIWFIYDRVFQDGTLMGAANSPSLVRTIKGLVVPPR